MPHRAVIVLVCLFLCVPAPSLMAATPTEIHARVSKTALILEGRDAQDAALLQASATALGDGLAATQCDLLGGAEKWVVIQGNRDYLAYPRERDEARNLCRLSVPGLRAAQPDVVPLKQVRVGQRAYAIGNALGLGLSLSEGLVSGIREIAGESWIQTTTPLAPGSEGGALFDEEGRLLGMTDYRKRDGQNVNFAAPAAWLLEITGRAGQADGAGQFATEAARLARARDWKGVAETAAAWARHQPERSDPWIWLGTAREGLGDHMAAAEAMETALARAPDSVPVILDLARNRLKLNQADQTLELLRPALARWREDAGLWFAKGVAELALGHGAEADLAFRETVKLDAWHASAWIMRHETALANGDFRAAQLAASHLTEIDPGRPDHWLRLAHAYLRLGRPARAMAAVERAAAIAPDSGDMLYWRGATLAARGQRGQAIDSLKRALAAGPPQPARVWQRLGNIYYELSLFPEAIAALREAVRLAPDQLSHQGELGVILKDGGLDKEALELFQSLRDKAPKDAFVWRQIGFVQAKLGHGAEAIAAMEQSLRLEPEQAKLWHALGETYAKSGRPDDARRVYQRLLGLNSQRAEQFYRAYLLPLEAQP